MGYVRVITHLQYKPFTNFQQDIQAPSAPQPFEPFQGSTDHGWDFLRRGTAQRATKENGAEICVAAGKAVLETHGRKRGPEDFGRVWIMPTWKYMYDFVFGLKFRACAWCFFFLTYAFCIGLKDGFEKELELWVAPFLDFWERLMIYNSTYVWILPFLKLA